LPNTSKIFGFLQKRLGIYYFDEFLGTILLGSKSQKQRYFMTLFEIAHSRFLASTYFWGEKTDRTQRVLVSNGMQFAHPL
jgi:hypothetical protein